MNSDEHAVLLKELCGESIRLDVFYYLLEHMDLSSKIYYGSYETVSRGLEVSLSAVIKAMKNMQEAGYLRMVKNGQWQISDSVQIFRKDEMPDAYKDEIAIEFRNYNGPAA